jgi:hypothetical protein
MGNSVEKLKRRTVGLEVMKTDNFTALVWNSCKICRSEKCPIVDRCSSFSGEGEICTPQKIYLENIYSAALDMLGISFSTREAIRLGVHIIPLYGILFELKIAVAGVGSVWEYYGAHGDRKVNPIYREIREHIKVIDEMWNKLGYKEVGSNLGGRNSLEGDGAYCDNMFNDD